MIQCIDQGKPINDAISKLWTVPVVTCTDQGKPIKETISKLCTFPVKSSAQIKEIRSSKCTDQGIHFQTVDSSSITSAQIKEIRSRKTDLRSHFQNVNSFCRTSAQITGKPINDAISKLWTVPIDQVQRSRCTYHMKTDQIIHF